ncbi:hypothetical protein RHMOL_Rhmol01G0202900 [Rhododendron molle]|uniref:Uncharacterized protein n=1 Tax=Rhododendron molle TaxID=49168 RepID=A0ACC0Q3S7_RHOML|nr:hypothetical protein RHMOL_Rhmol01G0202900 [Rhododendron molle]
MPRAFGLMETPPPPFFTVPGAATAVALPPPISDAGDGPSTSPSFSIIIVVIIIASAIIVSASIYLLLRCFGRRSFSEADDVVVSSSHHARHHNRCDLRAQQTDDDLNSSLPVFTFGSITGNIVGGDCAVCLSKFEPNDQLRLLPLCCHAFHTQCIDAWLLSNQTCPLCRSTVHPTETDVMNKILSSSATSAGGEGNSFRIEIGSLSRRRESGGRRSYSVGSFEYIVDEGGHEVAVELTHRRGVSDDKESTGVPPPGDGLAGEVAGRSWLRDYVDRIASISSRTLSFRSSGRFFTGSSRRSDAVEDLEANRVGEEISELFRWLSGV